MLKISTTPAAMQEMTYNTAVGLLDAAYSKWVRKRDAFRSTGSPDYSACFTCGRTFRTAQLENGHYITRGCKALRWHPKNTHSQCHDCNQFKSGNLKVYRENLVFCYGESVFDEFHKIRFGNFNRLNKLEMIELANQYNMLTAIMSASSIREEWGSWPEFAPERPWMPSGLRMVNPNPAVFNS